MVPGVGATGNVPTSEVMPGSGPCLNDLMLGLWQGSQKHIQTVLPSIERPDQWLILLRSLLSYFLMLLPCLLG